MDLPTLPAPAAADLSENARRVLEARYLRRDAARRLVETPAELFARVAAAVAGAEALLGAVPGEAGRWEEAFHGALAGLEFLPNSPTLMNAGTPLGQLSACFVLPVPDSMEGIFDALKQMALVQRGGGGTGFSFSRLRPRGDWVSSTGGEASGPVSFLRIFDSATAHIKQGGRRRGANMGVLRVDHPDILEFIAAKADGVSLPNFNLSVGITDGFMRAVAAGGSWPLMHPGSGRAVDILPARRVFDAIVDAAWHTGDPGLLFLDAIQRANPLPHLGDLEATNPCGEVPLLPHESCNLGSINLARLLRAAPGGREEPDWDRLAATVRLAVRFLDDVIEVNRHPTPAIAEFTRATRKLGLGVMGFAEWLIRLRLRYGSPEAVTLAGRLMAFIQDHAVRASEELAAVRGPFAQWRGSTWERRGRRVRNATLTAIAPTGTLSLIAGTTPGIEPLFALAYRRRHVLGDQTLPEACPLLPAALRRRGLDPAPVLEALRQGGAWASPAGLPDDLRRVFVTALDLTPEEHLRMQAAFQQHVDNAVSKTINLPHAATPADVAGAYQLAWRLGLKGITVYRYGSKAAQVLELGTEDPPWTIEHAARCDPQECRL
ncbi:MAG: Ribonucleoside-diphosphate reductase NrdZ [Verrucomicrobiota bacterium]|jgi:ribonucleoside-diphosphate reductase alpha chain